MSIEPSPTKAIAARIKGLRDDLGLSAAAIAELTGATPEAVQLYESGDAEIPVSYLFKLAKAGGVDLTALLTGADAHLHSHSLVRRGEGLEVERYKNYDYQSLAYRFNKPSMEPFLVTAPPRDKSELIANEHPGQEFIFMLRGRLEVTLGRQTMVLEPEDALYFDSLTPHALRALDGKDAVFLDVII